MLTFKYNEVYDYPAAVVFSRLTNLKGRTAWMKGIMENRVTLKVRFRSEANISKAENIRASNPRKPCL